MNRHLAEVGRIVFGLLVAGSVLPPVFAETAPTPAAAAAVAAEDLKPCEHGVPLVECKECRYEAGVVELDPKVGSNLVQRAVVEEVALARRLRLLGEVQTDPLRVVPVRVPAGGRVRVLNVKAGQKVAAGDVWVSLNSPDVEEAIAAWTTAKAQARAAAAKVEREEKLAAHRIGAAADLEEARRDHESAVAALDAARRKLLWFGQDPERIQADAATLQVTAPRAGVVSAIHVAEGQLVEANAEVGTVTDYSEVLVRCAVPAADLPVIAEALAGKTPPVAEVVIRGAKTPVRGVLTSVSREVDEASRTAAAVIRVANPDGQLRPGQFANVDVHLPATDAVPVVPRSAVFEDEGRAFVFQHWKDTLWRQRFVRTGRVEEDRVEILEGVEEGAEVASSGGFLLKSDVLREKMGAGCAD